MVQIYFLHVSLILCNLSFRLLVYVGERQRMQAVFFVIASLYCCVYRAHFLPDCAYGMFISGLVKTLNDH